MSTSTEVSRDFIYNIPEKILFHPEITLTQLRIYAIIRSFMDTTGIAYCSNNWLAQKVGVKRNAIIVGINALVAMGFIIKTQKDGLRFLSINISPTQIDPCIPKNTGGIPKDTGGGIPKDTQLDQTNIISRKEDSNYTRACARDPDLSTTPPNEEQQAYEYEETIFQSSYPIPSAQEVISCKGISTHRQGVELAVCDGFEAFWAMYPLKRNKNKARAQWIHDGCEEKTAEIIENLKDKIARDKAFKDGFITQPFNYIVQREYENPAFTGKTGNKGHFDYNDTSWTELETFDSMVNKLKSGES